MKELTQLFISILAAIFATFVAVWENHPILAVLIVLCAGLVGTCFAVRAIVPSSLAEDLPVDSGNPQRQSSDTPAQAQWSSFDSEFSFDVADSTAEPPRAQPFVLRRLELLVFERTPRKPA